jgi:hypothetical protein
LSHLGLLVREAASDKVYQLLAHGWWFSPGTPASSTTKTGRYDIAEKLLKVALRYIYSKYNDVFTVFCLPVLSNVNSFEFVDSNVGVLKTNCSFI